MTTHPQSSLEPIHAAVVTLAGRGSTNKFAGRVMDRIEGCQEDDDVTCSRSLCPPSPDVEYSLLLESIEDMFESMEEEEAHALTRIMSLSRPPTTNEMVRNKLDSMSSGDEDYYNDQHVPDDPLSAPKPLSSHPFLFSERSFDSSEHHPGPHKSPGPSYPLSTPIAIPGAKEFGSKGSRLASNRPASIQGYTMARGDPSLTQDSIPGSPQARGSGYRDQGSGVPGSPQAKSLVDDPAPPAAWFVADDPVTLVRYE